MKNIQIELKNILPTELVQVKPVFGQLNGQIPTEGATAPVVETKPMSHYSWSTSPLHLKNPITVAKIMESLSNHLFGGWGTLTVVGVKTNVGEGLVLSGLSEPMRKTKIYPKHELTGYPDYSGTPIDTTVTVWDLIAQEIARNEPILGSVLDTDLEDFATQGVTAFKTVVNANDLKFGTTRCLIIESGIVCTKKLVGNDEKSFGIVGKVAPQNVLEVVEIDSNVQFNSDDVMNPFIFDVNKQFLPETPAEIHVDLTGKGE